MYKIVYLIVFSLYLLCCGNSANRVNTAAQVLPPDDHLLTAPAELQYKLPYDLSSPFMTHVLDRKLVEVSSLAYDSSNNSFLTNDDESGYFYILNENDFSIRDEIKFSKKGDFEAIEIIDDKIFIAKSNGNIHCYNSSTQETEVLKTAFSSTNNVEGLCYDYNHQALLLACKGQPLADSLKNKRVKCIYSFDLKTNKLEKQPYIEIWIKELRNYVVKQNPLLSKAQLKKLVNRAKHFSPSGIAIHPEQGTYYIISAKGSSLAIYNNQGDFLHLAFLTDKTIPQPEGIIFDKDNNLYIATEGQGFSGKVFKFKMLKD